MSSLIIKKREAKSDQVTFERYSRIIEPAWIEKKKTPQEKWKEIVWEKSSVK